MGRCQKHTVASVTPPSRRGQGSEDASAHAAVSSSAQNAATDASAAHERGAALLEQPHSSCSAQCGAQSKQVDAGNCHGCLKVAEDVIAPTEAHPVCQTAQCETEMQSEQDSYTHNKRETPIDSQQARQWCVIASTEPAHGSFRALLSLKPACSRCKMPSCPSPSASFPAACTGESIV